MNFIVGGPLVEIKAVGNDRNGLGMCLDFPGAIQLFISPGVNQHRTYANHLYRPSVQPTVEARFLRS